MASGKSLVIEKRDLCGNRIYSGQFPLRSKKRDFKRWLKTQTSDKHIIRKALKRWRKEHGT